MGFLDPKPVTTAGLDAATAAKINAPGSATSTALSATFVSMSQAQIGLDTDGAPYFASGLAFADAVPVLTDTDGVPYYV